MVVCEQLNVLRTNNFTIEAWKEFDDYDTDYLQADSQNQATNFKDELENTNCYLFWYYSQQKLIQSLSISLLVSISPQIK